MFRWILALVLAGAGLFPAIAARAAIYTYQIDYRITDVVYDATSSCTDGGPTTRTFGCDVGPGSEFEGFFTTRVRLDELADGVHSGAEAPPLESFFSQIGDVIWDSNDLASEFEGYRSPSIGADGPGFIVDHGVLEGFYGGIVGSSDVPFVVFYMETGASDEFLAYDGLGNVTGNYRIARLAEPAPLILLAVGLAIMGLIGYLHRKRR